MRNGSVFFKSLFGLSALALVASFLSSCQKTSTSTVNVGDWAIESEVGGPGRTQAFSFTIHYPLPASDTVYIGGGYNSTSNTRLQDFYKFDESHNHSWIQVDSFPGQPRSGGAAFSINGKGYVIGGFDGNYYLNDVWQFDPANTPHWLQLPSLPAGIIARTGAIGFDIGNVGYFGTGLDSLGFYHNDMWQFDGNSWTQIASIAAERKGASVFVYNNIAYVVGGVDGNGQYLPDLSAFNPATTNPWSPRRLIVNPGDSSFSADYGFNITRAFAPVFTINDTAYLATGTYNGILNTTWCYDIGQDLWFQKTSFEGTARENAIGFTVNNHGYIATGDNGSNDFNDTWQFFPDAAQTADDNYQ